MSEPMRGARLAVVLTVALLAGCGGSHKRPHVGPLTPEQAYTITGFSPVQTYTLGSSGAKPHHRSAPSYASPNDNVYVSSGDSWPLQASPPSLTVLKQYVVTYDDLAFPNIQESAIVQVVKVPGIGRCVIVSTGGVWCK